MSKVNWLVSVAPALAPLLMVLGCGAAASKPVAGPSASNGSLGADPGAKPVDIEKAALPFAFVDARTGKSVDADTAWSLLTKARVVCVGEDHPNPHHHWAQLAIVRGLAERQAADRTLGLGMEMFGWHVQGVLDDFAAGKIDEATMLSRSAWRERWGYDWALYRLQVVETLRHRGLLVGLNAPKELSKKVVRLGVNGLSPEDKDQLPEMELDDPQHKGWFEAVMADMGGHGQGHHKTHGQGDGKSQGQGHSTDKPGPSMANIYAAQVLWDESMADRSAKWLIADPRSRKLIIMAGNGHCHDSAIMRRLTRRLVAPVISVRPVLDTEGGVAEALASANNDLLMVLSVPSQAAQPAVAQP